MLLSQDFTAEGNCGHWAQGPMVSSLCIKRIVQPQLRLCDNIVLLCGLCGAERSEAGCRGNKLQLLSILREKTRTAKDTVTRSLARCSMKWFQFCLSTTSRLTSLYLPLSHTSACINKIGKHTVCKYTCKHKGGYGDMAATCW